MASKKTIVVLMLITLVALVATGCSNSNDPVSATVVDTTPPAGPAALDLNYADGAAVVSWAANTTDSDLAGYIVTREHYGVTETLVSSPTMMTSYVDSDPLPGTSLYHVYAVDNAGNQSAVATVSLTITQSHQTRELSN